MIEERDLDEMSEDQVRRLLSRIITGLRLAEDDGVFGADSWEGFLDIEVE